MTLKSPFQRNIVPTAPYMLNSVALTLETVIHYNDQAGGRGLGEDARFAVLHLTAGDVGILVMPLHTPTGDNGERLAYKTYPRPDLPVGQGQRREAFSNE